MKLSLKSRRIVSVLVLALLAAYYLLRDTSLRFEEEVQLESGEVIRINRHIKTKSFGEIGGSGGWESAYNNLLISRAADTDKPPIWVSETGLIPMLLDRDLQTREWFLVATFYSCQAWYDLGRPKRPYVEFRARNGQWQKVELSPQLTGRAANVMTGVRSGGEPKLLTLAAKRVRDADPAIASEYLRIVDRWSTGC